MPKKIGEVLIGKNMLTVDQLDHALKAQLILGGHLGTCFIELGFVDEKDLGRVLAEMHGVPYAEPEILWRLPAPVVAALPAKLAERHRVIPIGVEGKTLRLAMVNPADLHALDEIQFATGLKLEPWVSPEVRIVEGLERYYGVARRPRYIAICRELNRRRAPVEAAAHVAVAASLGRGAADASSSPLPQADAPPLEDEVSFGYGRSWTEIAERFAEGDLPERDHARTATAVATGFADDEPGTGPAAAEPPMTLQDVAFLLCGADEVDHVASAVLDYTSAVAVRSILFNIKDGQAGVWDQRGFADSRDRIKGVHWPVTSGWILEALGGNECYRGPVESTAIQRGLFGVLGAAAPTEAVVVPIHLNDRIVAILYVDGGPGGAIGESDRSFLRLGTMVSLALSLLVLKKKIRAFV